MKAPPSSGANALAADGVRLMRKGKLKAAARAFRESLRQNPRQFVALEALGVLCGMAGDIEEAARLLRRATESDPTAPTAAMNLGLALMQLSRRGEAAAAFETAARLDPSVAEAHERLGEALLGLGRLDEAAPSFARAVAREPENAQALSSLVETKRKLCDWDGIEALESKLVALVSSGKAAAEPLVLLHVTDDAALLRANAAAYWRDFYKPGLPRELLTQRFEHKPRTRERIRLCYLSADFREHATAYLMAELFELHDRRRFEVIGISYGPDDKSATRGRLEGAFDTFLDVSGAKSSDIARKIWSLGVDIAVDLKGYTAFGRPEILAARPAPVQCHWIGYPGTLGTDFIDYNIVDGVVAPTGADEHFTELLVRLPDCYQVNDRKRPLSPAPTRASCGLPANAFVSCSFNNPHKFTPALFDVWMRILHAVPNSVLWLYADNDWAPANLAREAAARAIDPARLVFAKPMPLAEHLARLQLADLFLDTLPYGAHTTASDALWVGLPVVTCLGAGMQSRVCASLLTATDMPELITTSLDGYEKMAMRLATDLPRLRELKDRLRRQRNAAPLFDTERFCRNVEAAFVAMWARWLNGERPRHVEVESG